MIIFVTYRQVIVNILKITVPQGPGKNTIILKFVNKQCCKLFWRRCVEYHAFFRLKRRDYTASRPSLAASTAPAGTLTRGLALMFRSVV